MFLRQIAIFFAMLNILPSTYLGNVQYFSKLCFGECIIDLHEHYVKQSYRSRARIMTAGGPTDLVVNTVKGNNFNKSSVKETRIDYSKRWQHAHRISLISAYGNAPYFSHYWDRLEPFFTRRYRFLADLNTDLTAALLELLGCKTELKFCEKYTDSAALAARGVDFTDFRNTLSPKPRLMRPDPAFRPEPYWQVFSDRFPFAPNLSVVDLLFCEGPDAIDVLRRSALY